VNNRTIQENYTKESEVEENAELPADLSKGMAEI